MPIRSSYPDELSRVNSFCLGATFPINTRFLVDISAPPIERIRAVFPYWLKSEEGNIYEFSLYYNPNCGNVDQLLDNALEQLQLATVDAGGAYLRTQSSYTKDSPMFHFLSERGYTVAQTDRYFAMPAESVITRCKRIYQKVQRKIPQQWNVQSIRGQNPAEIFKLVSIHSLMSYPQFQKYWDSSNLEHFEENYSCVILNEGTIIATFLHTQRGNDELHIHVDAIHPDHSHHSGYATIAMRNWIAHNLPKGFPKIFTSRADDQRHIEGGNTPLRYQGGTEAPPRHFLSKNLEAH